MNLPGSPAPRRETLNMADRSARQERDMLIALRESMKQAEKSVVRVAARMKAGRWTIANFTLMPTHSTRHSKAHKDLLVSLTTTA